MEDRTPVPVAAERLAPGCPRMLLRALVFLYLGSLTAGLLAMRFIGEAGLLTGSALFLPPWIWILPAAPLALAGLFVDRKLALLMAAIFIAYAWLYLGCQWNPQPAARPGDLSVVSCNLGMDLPASDLQPFVRRQDADIVCVQEAYGRVAEMKRAFPGYEARAIDQFPILSRFPIVAQRVIELQAGPRREPCAARYEIDFRGQRIAVYNVHLPTPRLELKEVWARPRLILPWLPGAKDRARHRALSAGWKDRAARLRELDALLRTEPLPAIVAGDFNMPAHGAGYARFTTFLRDAFTERGRGYGWTFPSDRVGRLADFAPWLRIDYQFVSAEWEVTAAAVEPPRVSQHLATAARYRLESR